MPGEAPLHLDLLNDIWVWFVTWSDLANPTIFRGAQQILFHELLIADSFWLYRPWDPVLGPPEPAGRGTLPGVDVVLPNSSLVGPMVWPPIENSHLFINRS